MSSPPTTPEAPDSPIPAYDDTVELAPESGYNLDAKIEYRNLKYKLPTDHLNCPICQQPFIEPLTTICGHTFCKECIQECFKMAKDGNVTRGSCPLDRTPLDATNINQLFPTPLLITNLVDDLKVYCLNQTRGCEWNGSRWELEHHLDFDCNHTGVVCHGIRHDEVDDEGNPVKCPRLVERQYLGKSSECAHKLYTCKFCKKQVCKITENTHLETECLFNYKTCDLCLNDCIAQKNLEKHRENCSHVGHITCLARDLGCKWMGGNETLLEIHLENCPLFQFMPVYQKLSDQVSGLATENQFLQKQINKILDLIIQGKITNLGYAENLETILLEKSSATDQQLLCVNFELDRLKYEVNEKILPFISKQRQSEQELMMSNIMNDSFMMREDLNLQRMVINSLRKQIQFMMFSRGPHRMMGLNPMSGPSIDNPMAPPFDVRPPGAGSYMSYEDMAQDLLDSSSRSSLEERICLKL